MTRSEISFPVFAGQSQGCGIQRIKCAMLMGSEQGFPSLGPSYHPPIFSDSRHSRQSPDMFLTFILNCLEISLKYEGQIALYESIEPRVSCYLLRLYPSRPGDLTEWRQFFLFNETSFGNTRWNPEWKIYIYPFQIRWLIHSFLLIFSNHQLCSRYLYLGHKQAKHSSCS